jgi:hypothetical protein
MKDSTVLDVILAGTFGAVMASVLMIVFILRTGWY